MLALVIVGCLAAIGALAVLVVLLRRGRRSACRRAHAPAPRRPGCLRRTLPPAGGGCRYAAELKAKAELRRGRDRRQS